MTKPVDLNAYRALSRWRQLEKSVQDLYDQYSHLLHQGPLPPLQIDPASLALLNRKAEEYYGEEDLIDPGFPAEDE